MLKKDHLMKTHPKRVFQIEKEKQEAQRQRDIRLMQKAFDDFELNTIMSRKIQYKQRIANRRHQESVKNRLVQENYVIKKPIYEERVRDNKILNEVEWQKKIRAITERIDRPRIRRVASHENIHDFDYEDDSHSNCSSISSTEHKLAKIEEKLQNS